MPKSMVRREEYVRLIHRLRIFVAMGLLASFGVFIAVAIFGGFSNVLGIIEHANMELYSLAFVCVFAGYIARYGKWSYYMRILDIKVDQFKSFLIYLSSYSMELTPGRVGHIIAAYTMKKVTKIKFMSIVPIVTMDLFTDFLGFALIAVVTALYIGRYVGYVFLFVAALLVPFVIVINPWMFNAIKSRKKKGRILRKLEEHGNRYYVSQSRLNRPSVYIGSLAFTIPADILNSLGLYFSFLAVGIRPNPAVSFFIFSTSQIFGMASALPGSIGVADATIVALSRSMLGIGPAISSAVTIMARIATLWFGVILGMLLLFYTMRYWKKK